MNLFVQYLKDKRFFIGLYLLTMLFVTLILVLAVDRSRLTDILAYTIAGCFFMAGTYLIAGFFYHGGYYSELMHAIQYEEAEIAAALPEPQNGQQAMYHRLLIKLQEMHENRLQQLLNEKKEHQEFIMSWIHEVKLPIAASRLLIENSGDKSAEFLADKIEDELNKIENYVEQALYFSRIDTFTKDYFITEVSLQQIVKSSVKKYAKLFINKSIRFQMDGTPLHVHSDSKWLAFIVDQLITNSLKYTAEGGSITVCTEEDGEEKRVSIHDTGVGIKPEELHRVFDKGFTGSIGRTHSRSTGMGLYLAKQMALKLGHEISIRSEEGIYTQVSVHFRKVGNYYRLQ